jgi:hypothetical protein
VTEYIDVWPKEPTVTVDAADAPGQIAVVIENGTQKETLWYSSSDTDFYNKDMDAFALGLVFYAMERGKALRIRGNVSPSLLANLEEFQAAWAFRKGEVYKVVDIRADSEVEIAPAADRPALAAFSGGLDSCFTMQRHKNGLCGRLKQDVQAGLFVQGFDIPLDDDAAFGRAAARAKGTLASLGVPLITLATNFKDLNIQWDDTHVLGLVSAMTLLKHRFSLGLIGSTLTYNETQLNWGSNVITDHLLSSRSFEVVHDGAAFTRIDKFRAVAGWPEAYNELRLCYSADRKDENCCRCWKCLVNMLRMRALNLPLPPTFPHEVSDDQIAEVTGLSEIGVISFEAVRDAARKFNAEGSWLTEIDKCIARNRKALGVNHTCNTKPTSWLNRLIDKVKAN